MFFQAMYHFSSFRILKTHFWTFAITRNRKTFIFWWWLNVSCCKGRWFWCSCVILVRKGVCLWSLSAAVGASLLRQQLASVRLISAAQFCVICFRLASPSCPAPNLLECATQVVSYNQHSKSRDLCLESWSKVVTHIWNNQMKEAWEIEENQWQMRKGGLPP